jgi:SMC interacting uncharacterized protein involved in chromosome segregation
MYSEKEHLDAELVLLAKQKEALAKQLWEEEVATSRAVDRLEGKVQSANLSSQRRGVAHELALPSHLLEAEPSSSTHLDPSGGLLPKLHALKSATAAEVTQAQDDLLISEEGATRREEDRQERLEQLSTLKAALAKLERDDKALRDEHVQTGSNPQPAAARTHTAAAPNPRGCSALCSSLRPTSCSDDRAASALLTMACVCWRRSHCRHAAELAGCKAEVEKLEDQIRKAKSHNGQEVAQSASELSALQKEYDDFTAHAAASRERMYNLLISSLDMLSLHKENVETQLRGLKTHCEAKRDALMVAIRSEAVELA